MYKRLQEYNTSLQQYNSKLQSELHQTNEILKNAEKEKVAVLENISSLRGQCASLQEQLTATKVGILLYELTSAFLYRNKVFIIYGFIFRQVTLS